MNTPFRYVALLAVPLMSIACSSEMPAHRVETGGAGTIRTVDQIDDQDWAEAATKLTRSMMGDPRLFTPAAGGGPRILAIGRVINNTSQVVDTDLLVKQIRVTLNQSGKVLTRTTDDQTVRDASMNAMMNDKQIATPDYRLSGKLIENDAFAGNVRQSTFYFQLSLTDQSGNDVWEGQQPITKIGSTNSIGM